MFCNVFAIHNSSLIPELLKGMLLVCVHASWSVWVYFLRPVCKWLSYCSRSFLWPSNYSRDRIVTNWYQKLLRVTVSVSRRDTKDYITFTDCSLIFDTFLKKSVSFCCSSSCSRHIILHNLSFSLNPSGTLSVLFRTLVLFLVVRLCRDDYWFNLMSFAVSA